MQALQEDATAKPALHADRPLAWQVDPFCRAIGISRTTLYEMIKEQKIHTVVIGGRRLIPNTEAERLLAGTA